MATNQAVVVDQKVPGKLIIHDIAMPQPLPSEALVRVSAISLNRGETLRSIQAEDGWRPGGTSPVWWNRLPQMAQVLTRVGVSWASCAMVPGRNMWRFPAMHSRPCLTPSPSPRRPRYLSLA